MSTCSTDLTDFDWNGEPVLRLSPVAIAVPHRCQWLHFLISCAETRNGPKSLSLVHCLHISANRFIIVCVDVRGSFQSLYVSLSQIVHCLQFTSVP